MLESLVRRYRELRGISCDIHNSCMDMVSGKTIQENVSAIGLMRRGWLHADEEELVLVNDLCVYTARPGRTRAIDRFARATRYEDGTDEAMLLAAKLKTRFSAWRIVALPQSGGLVVEDTLRGGEMFVMDEALSLAGQYDSILMSRVVITPEFGMFCGANVPLNADVAETLEELLPASMSGQPREKVADDDRFTICAYRAAVLTGAMMNVVTVEVPAAA